MSNRMVRVSAPGKLMLFGEHAVVYNRPCIVTAVDMRLSVQAELSEDRLIKARIHNPDGSVQKYEEPLDNSDTSATPKQMRFLSAAIRNLFRKFQLSTGVHIETKSEFITDFGLGSSSAVTVAVIKALSELLDKAISNQDLFELSYQTVLNVQEGAGSGFDVAAAIWGGTIYFVTGGTEIVPLDIGSLPLIVGFTGVKAETPMLVRRVKKYRSVFEGIFDNIAEVVNEARQQLEAGNMGQVGELMNVNQRQLDSLGVSSPELAGLILGARQAGALGAKQSGAGGGDCMIALASEESEHLIKKSINMAGEVVSAQTNAPGVRIEN